MDNIRLIGDRLIKNLEQVIVGKKEAIELVVVGLLSQGHVLIEDVPGVGKTVLARSLAKSLGCTFNRLQFTPDMLPSDVTGVSIYDQAKKEFKFREGPIFAQIVLADEINRATPKTQAALLEAMDERQTTVDGVTHPLPMPFMVLATQNPIEYEGTFPLPEAQLDRFLLRVRLGYPNPTHEVEMLTRQQHRHPIDALSTVITQKELMSAMDAVKHIHVTEAVKTYIVDLTNRTRQHAEVYLGASPRGSLAMMRTSQAVAALNGREFVIPDDVKFMAGPVLAHRIIVGPAARLSELSAEKIVAEIVQIAQVPGGEFFPER
jgi:MoxR-like ATPase